MRNPLVSWFLKLLTYSQPLDLPVGLMPHRMDCSVLILNCSDGAQTADCNMGVLLCILYGPFINFRHYLGSWNSAIITCEESNIPTHWGCTVFTTLPATQPGVK